MHTLNERVREVHKQRQKSKCAPQDNSACPAVPISLRLAVLFRLALRTNQLALTEMMLQALLTHLMPPRKSAPCFFRACQAIPKGPYISGAILFLCFLIYSKLQSCERLGQFDHHVYVQNEMVTMSKIKNTKKKNDSTGQLTKFYCLYRTKISMKAMLTPYICTCTMVLVKTPAEIRRGY